MSDLATPASPSVFATGFANQMRVIGALMMRELHTRYGRENVGYLWVILEPMTLAVGVALIHAAAPSHSGSDINAIALASLGYVCFIMFRAIFTRAEGVVESNAPLLYHRMVTLIDIMVSRALLEAAGSTCTLAVMLFFGIMLGIADLPYRPLYLLFGLFLMMWFSLGMGMLCCAVTHENRLAGRIIHPATYLMMPISGGFYMLQWIPLPYRDWLWWFPLVQIFELLRHGQFRAAPDTFFSVPYVLGCNMALLFLGILSLRLIRRKIHLN